MAIERPDLFEALSENLLYRRLGFREELMPETWLLRREGPRAGALRPLEGNLALHRRQSPSKTGHKTQKLSKRTGLIGESLPLYQSLVLFLLRLI